MMDRPRTRRSNKAASTRPGSVTRTANCRAATSPVSHTITARS